jgi:DnaJ like chaperone protein
MSCTGKFLGALLGLIFYNVPGAIIGFVLGHFLFDARAKKTPHNPPEAGNSSRYHSTTTAPTPGTGYATPSYSGEFLEALCGMMAKLTKSDGSVSNEEIQMMERFFDEALQLDSGARRFAIDSFREAKDSTVAFGAYARKFAFLTTHNPEIRPQVLQLLMTLAAADRAITSQEDALLKEAASIFAVQPKQYADLRKNYGSPMEHYYAVLGVPNTATNEEIKDRYRQLAREYHPDTVNGKGMPKDFVEYATKRFQEIQEAYSKIRDERGFR